MLALDDQTQLTTQMGRTPRGVVAIAARCPAGHPCVVTCYPLRHEGARLVPFPTLYWLTCPALSARVSHLERDGVIAALEAELAGDQALQAGLRRDHERYIAARSALLAPDDRQLASEHGVTATMDSRGIGGMTNFTAVKCLHLHLAQHLVGGNVIGQLIVKRYGLRMCEAP